MCSVLSVILEGFLALVLIYILFIIARFCILDFFELSLKIYGFSQLLECHFKMKGR